MNRHFEGDADVESAYGPGTDLIVALLAVVLVLLQLSRASLGSLGGGVVDLQYVSRSKDALRRELCLAVDGASRACSPNALVAESAFEIVDVAANQTLRFDQSVLFRQSASELTQDGRMLLGKVIQALSRCQGVLREVQVQGHTDETGGEVPNVLLGHQRAMEVWKLLSVNNLDRHQVLFSVASYGRAKPVDWSPKEAEGPARFEVGTDSPRLARNRRVELLLIYKLAPTAGNSACVSHAR